jgi:hypothetical protein
MPPRLFGLLVQFALSTSPKIFGGCPGMGFGDSGSRSGTVGGGWKTISRVFLTRPYF